jgi:hypothetical protein
MPARDHHAVRRPVGDGQRGSLLERHRVRHRDQVVRVHRDALAEAPVAVLAQRAAVLDVRVNEHSPPDPLASHPGADRMDNA